VKTNPDLLHCA